MGTLSGGKRYQYIYIIAREIDMTSIFKGYHFASLKEWKGRKKYDKGFVIKINSRVINDLKPLMEALREIKKSRIILTEPSLEPPTITITPKRKSHHATDYKTTYLRKRDLLQGRMHPSKQMVARWGKRTPKLRH